MHFSFATQLDHIKIQIITSDILQNQICQLKTGKKLIPWLWVVKRFVGTRKKSAARKLFWYRLVEDLVERKEIGKG